MMSINLCKAFDIIEYASIFRALGYHGLSPAYTILLQSLYSNQIGTGGESSPFKILRGVKQGDILSSIIFNCVLDIAFEDWKAQLSTEGFLIDNQRNSERLTNTRYADDILRIWYS